MKKKNTKIIQAVSDNMIPKGKLSDILNARKKGIHAYEESEPYTLKNGKKVQNLFCNKCGLSTHHKIHKRSI